MLLAISHFRLVNQDFPLKIQILVLLPVVRRQCKLNQLHIILVAVTIKFLYNKTFNLVADAGSGFESRVRLFDVKFFIDVACWRWMSENF